MGCLSQYFLESMILNTVFQRDSHKSTYVHVREIMKHFNSENEQCSTTERPKMHSPQTLLSLDPQAKASCFEESLFPAPSEETGRFPTSVSGKGQLQFPTVAMRNYRRLSDLKQRKCTVSHFQRPKVQDQDVCRAVLPLKFLRQNLFLPFLASHGGPWLGGRITPILPPSLHGLLPQVSVSSSLFLRIPVIGCRIHPKPRMISAYILS